jgi:hypothetical protein
MSDRRSCISCGQPIPPGAKLAGRVITRGELARLRGKSPGSNAQEQVSVDICLQCQIRLSRLEAR